jgi:hypothetical protein
MLSRKVPLQRKDPACLIAQHQRASQLSDLGICAEEARHGRARLAPVRLLVQASSPVRRRPPVLTERKCARCRLRACARSCARQQDGHDGTRHPRRRQVLEHVQAEPAADPAPPRLPAFCRALTRPNCSGGVETVITASTDIASTVVAIEEAAISTSSSGSVCGVMSTTAIASTVAEQHSVESRYQRRGVSVMSTSGAHSHRSHCAASDAAPSSAPCVMDSPCRVARNVRPTPTKPPAAPSSPAM